MFQVINPSLSKFLLGIDSSYTRGLEQLPTHMTVSLLNVSLWMPIKFHACRGLIPTAFLCRSKPRRRSSSVFIAFSLVLLSSFANPLSGPVSTMDFLSAYRLYCRAHTHRLPVIKFRATRLVYRAVEFCCSHDVPTVVCSQHMTLEF